MLSRFRSVFRMPCAEEVMKTVIAGLTALAFIAPSTCAAETAALQIAHRHWHRHPSGEDSSAPLDAWLASQKARLKLSPEQEKYWPPVERVLRDILLAREDRVEELREKRKPEDAIAGLRDRASGMAQSSAHLKRLADAAEPLYRTLSSEQQRRFHTMFGIGGWRYGGWRYRHRRHRHRFWH
jgi:hypothetical protein